MRKVIAARWVLDEPGAAMDWLATSPDSEEMQFAVRVTYATWAIRDADAAVAWMKEKIAGNQPPAIGTH